MKKATAAAALAMAVAAPASASITESEVQQCIWMKDVAESAMWLRQNGIPLNEVVAELDFEDDEYSEFRLSLVTRAYSYPARGSDEIVDAFAVDVFAICIDHIKGESL